MVIANTSPLLYLHQVGCLQLLPALYGSVVIPPAVRDELEAGGRQGFDVPVVGDLGRIALRTVAAGTLVPAVVDLGRGEAEVIALGLESPGSLLILDDPLGRRIADLHALRYTGTLGVLVKAKRAGHIQSVGGLIPVLRRKGMWLDDATVHEALRLAGQ